MAGTVVAVLAFSKAHAFAHGYDFTESFRFSWSLAYIALLLLAAYGVGLPDLPKTRLSAAIAALGSMVSAVLGISIAQLVVGSAVLPRSVIVGASATMLPLLVVCAELARYGSARDGRRDRVVAVTGLAEGIYLSAELNARPERPAILATVLAPATASSPRPGARPLIDAVRAAEAAAVVLDRVALADESIVAQASELHESGVRIRTLSSFYDEWLGKLPVSELERASLLFDIGTLHRPGYVRMKRLIDVVSALGGLTVLGAVLPVVWLGNKVGNAGPLFYTQARVGAGGREFRIFKFRTMSVDDGPSTWTSEGDPRITRFGALLRRTHLDELPQMLNILRGDLSLVGPRPEQPHYVQDLSGKISFYNLRHLARPGLTGWAQVKYAYGSSSLDAYEKLQYDFYYLRHQSLVFDFRIMGRTIRSVIGRAGR
jgi:lipopolysaccharide/colanic/teichoic acid biosynthesis glycosyltransferase